MNILSLFDGMSGAQIALERAQISVSNYFASEVDKFAIKITQKNYPKTIQKGDVDSINKDTLNQSDSVSPFYWYKDSDRDTIILIVDNLNPNEQVVEIGRDLEDYVDQQKDPRPKRYY